MINLLCFTIVPLWRGRQTEVRRGTLKRAPHTPADVAHASACRRRLQPPVWSSLLSLFAWDWRRWRSLGRARAGLILVNLQVLDQGPPFCIGQLRTDDAVLRRPAWSVAAISGAEFVTDIQIPGDR